MDKNAFLLGYLEKKAAMQFTPPKPSTDIKSWLRNTSLKAPFMKKPGVSQLPQISGGPAGLPQVNPGQIQTPRYGSMSYLNR